MSMIPKKAVELTGEALNYAVAVSQGHAVSIEPAQLGVPSRVFIETGLQKIRYRPEKDGAQAMALIEKYGICVLKYGSALKMPESQSWTGTGRDQDEYVPDCESPLVVACRVAVLIELGETVDIPAVLLTEQEHSK